MLHLSVNLSPPNSRYYPKPYPQNNSKYGRLNLGALRLCSWGWLPPIVTKQLQTVGYRCCGLSCNIDHTVADLPFVVTASNVSHVRLTALHDFHHTHVKCLRQAKLKKHTMAASQFTFSTAFPELLYQNRSHQIKSTSRDLRCKCLSWNATFLG